MIWFCACLLIVDSPCRASVARSRSRSRWESCTRSSAAESSSAEQPPPHSSSSLFSISFIRFSSATSSCRASTSSRSSTTQTEHKNKLNTIWRCTLNFIVLDSIIPINSLFIIEEPLKWQLKAGQRASLLITLESGLGFSTVLVCVLDLARECLCECV